MVKLQASAEAAVTAEAAGGGQGGRAVDNEERDDEEEEEEEDSSQHFAGREPESDRKQRYRAVCSVPLVICHKVIHSEIFTVEHLVRRFFYYSHVCDGIRPKCVWMKGMTWKTLPSVDSYLLT